MAFTYKRSTALAAPSAISATLSANLATSSHRPRRPERQGDQALAPA
jgi:hypothetical protein